MKTFRKGGIHPAGNKLTAGRPIGVPKDETGRFLVESGEFHFLPSPIYSGEYTLLLSQSIGAPSKPVVKVGDEVHAHQMIAEAGGFVSAPIHTPVSGKVKKIDKVRDSLGLWRDAVTIDCTEINDSVECLPRSASEVEMLSPAEINRILGDSGIVGLGGATFPTRVKLSIPEGKKADVVLINGAECEPYLTCDDRLMQECPDEIVKGILLIMKAVGAPKAIIGIEENKPRAIEALTRATLVYQNIHVCELKKKYPQGGEKQLIEAIVGKEVPLGGLPIDVGVVVDNVATAYAVAEAVWLRKPLTRRVVTITGPKVRGGNYIVPIGLPISRLLRLAQVNVEDGGKVIAGGPMMGRSISNLDAPVTKGLGGLLILPPYEAHRKQAQECIRCGECVSACPMGLEPYHLMTLAEFNEWEEMKHRNVMACIECGSCTYVCPANRPILDFIKLGKLELRKK